MPSRMLRRPGAESRSLGLVSLAETVPSQKSGWDEVWECGFPVLLAKDLLLLRYCRFWLDTLLQSGSRFYNPPFLPLFASTGFGSRSRPFKYVKAKQIKPLPFHHKKAGGRGYGTYCIYCTYILCSRGGQLDFQSRLPTGN